MVYAICLLLGLLLWAVLKSTLNEVYSVGPVYWIKRDIGNDKTPLLSRAFMRQTTSPWRVGRGVQVCVGKYTLQVGVCRSNPHAEDDVGLLHAMEGRYLDSDVDEIRKWQ